MSTESMRERLERELEKITGEIKFCRDGYYGEFDEKELLGTIQKFTQSETSRAYEKGYLDSKNNSEGTYLFVEAVMNGMKPEEAFDRFCMPPKD